MSSAARRTVVSYVRKGKPMNHDRTDAAGAPIIEGASGKIAVLERRRSYLQRKLERPGYDAVPAADFDRHEVSALHDAVRAMRFHAASLRPEVDPVTHLIRLTRAAERVLNDTRQEIEDGVLTSNESALEKAIAEAREALTELA